MGAVKALLEYGGETFLDRLIGVFGEHCGMVVAVLGYGAEGVARGLKRQGEAVLVMNAEPERGQFSSLQAGLRVAAGRGCAVFFHLVDMPAIEGGTVVRLCEAWEARAEGTMVLQPTFKGKRGHPVLLAPEAAARMTAMDGGRTAREALAEFAGATVEVEVEDAGVCRDADTPEEYRAMREGARRN